MAGKMSTNPELSHRRRHLLVIPFPAQGHLIPLLDLAHHLSLLDPELSITVFVTPANLPLLSPLLAHSPSINPLVLPFHSPLLPPGVEHVRDLPASASIAVLMLALSSLRSPLLHWARSNQISAVLSDFFLGWTHHLASDLSVPRLAFFSSGPLLALVVQGALLHEPRRQPDAPNGGVVSLPSLPDFPYDHLPSFYRRFAAAGAGSGSSPEWAFAGESMLANFSSWAAVLNTFDALEPSYLSRLRQIYGHDRVWAVGPIAPAIPTAGRGGSSFVAPEEIAAWLDPCPARSVVYACFGSQFKMAPAQARALADGLERSGARFVWAVGPAEVPEGFEERVRGRGLVVRGWAPQVAVLGHGSVGSFVTHCGWNSVLEGIVAGVALLCWPMEADQFVNARLLVEEAGVAVLACAGGPDAVPDPEELARKLGESVGERSWTEVRGRAAEMGRKAAEAVAEGGSSYRDMEELVKELRRARC